MSFAKNIAETLRQAADVIETNGIPITRKMVVGADPKIEIIIPEESHPSKVGTCGECRFFKKKGAQTSGYCDSVMSPFTFMVRRKDQEGCERFEAE